MKKLILFFLACSLITSPAMATISMPKPSKAAFEQFSKKIAEIAHKPVKAVSHDAKALWIWGLKKLKFNKEPLSKQEIDNARRAFDHLFYTGLTIATIAWVLGWLLYLFKDDIRYQYQSYKRKQALKKIFAQMNKNIQKSEEESEKKRQDLLAKKDPEAIWDALTSFNTKHLIEALDQGIDPNAATVDYSFSPLQFADFSLRLAGENDANSGIKELIKHGINPYEPLSSINFQLSENPEIQSAQDLDNHPELQRYTIKDQLGNYTHIAPYVFMSPEGRKAADEAAEEYINKPRRQANRQRMSTLFHQTRLNKDLPQLPKEMYQEIHKHLEEQP